MIKIKISYDDYTEAAPILAAIREAAEEPGKEKRIRRKLEKGEIFDRIYISIGQKTQ